MRIDDMIVSMSDVVLNKFLKSLGIASVTTLVGGISGSIAKIPRLEMTEKIKQQAVEEGLYHFVRDQILLYTDGVTEANDIDNNLYGEDKLLNLLNSNSNVSSKELCNIVKSSVDRFVGDNEQFDDITMLSLKVNCITGEDRVLVCPDKNSIKTINEFADKLTYRVEAIPKVANKINIIIDEIFSNIVNYSKANLAEISYSIENNNLYITFVDNGIPYNPLLEKEPDITLGAEERQLGGLGIFMVRKMVENIEYKYDENKNILCITMNLI